MEAHESDLSIASEVTQARVTEVLNQIDCSVEDVLFSQKGDEIGLQVTWCPVDQRSGNCIARWWPVEPSYPRRVCRQKAS